VSSLPEQRLLERAFALDDVDEVIQPAALCTMMRSRLRSPMSKVDDRDLLCRGVRDRQERLAEVVVFPTPPLPM